MQEVWKLVPGLEDYAVSNIGNVKRVAYSLNNMRPRPRKTRIDKDGYVQIVFFKQGRRISTQVHRVVASAFIGLCPLGYQVNHINGVRNDNRLENLEYLTPSENKKHGFRIGISTRLVGEKSATARLCTKRPSCTKTPYPFCAKFLAAQKVCARLFAWLRNPTLSLPTTYGLSNDCLATCGRSGGSK